MKTARQTRQLRKVTEANAHHDCEFRERLSRMGDK